MKWGLCARSKEDFVSCARSYLTSTKVNRQSVTTFCVSTRYQRTQSRSFVNSRFGHIMAVYIISPGEKRKAWLGINGDKGGIEVEARRLNGDARDAQYGQRDPRPAKYQRLSREIERLCMEIRMYRLPPNNHSSRDEIFSNLTFKCFVARDRKKDEERLGLLIYSMPVYNFHRCYCAIPYCSVSDHFLCLSSPSCASISTST